MIVAASVLSLVVDKVGSSNVPPLACVLMRCECHFKAGPLNLDAKLFFSTVSSQL